MDYARSRDITVGNQRIPLALAVVALLLSFGAVAQEVATTWVDDDFTAATEGWNATHFATIQDGISAVDVGGTVNVATGMYNPVGGRLVIDKSITLQANAALGIQGPGPANRPHVALGYFSYTNCAVQIAADNVVVDGLEFENNGWNTGGYIVGDYGSAKHGWTVRNCDIHSGSQGVRILGNNVTIEYNNIHDTRGDCIDCEYGPCLGLKVRHNWLHSHHTDSGKKPAGITYTCSAGVGADVEITYNECWANRTFVDLQNDGTDGSPTNYSILIAHNTVDWGLADLPGTPSSSDLAQQMSVAWWAGSGTWDATKFVIRDNLFARQKWYAIVDSDDLLQGQVQVQNCLFWNWHLAGDLYPDYAYVNEWPGARGAVGWADMGDGNGFVMTDCLTQDPLFAAVGDTPDTYYALRHAGSPAYGAATDGTNIGAWQGTPPSAAVWVDDSWTGQADVDAFNPGLAWQVDAFATIQSGVDAVGAGGTVNVAPGTYEEALTIGKPLTLHGDASGDRPQVVLPDGTVGVITIQASDVTLGHLHVSKEDQASDTANINITRGGTWPSYTIEHGNVVLDGLIVEKGRRGAVITGRNVTIVNCQFLDQARDALFFNAVAGTTSILDNYFRGDPASSKKAVLFENHSSGDPAVSGTINVDGNVVDGKNNFLVYNQWVVEPAGLKTELSIMNNTVTGLGSTAIAFVAPGDFAKFQSILISDNTIVNGQNRLAVYVDYRYGGEGFPADGQIMVHGNILSVVIPWGVDTDTVHQDAPVGFSESAPVGMSLAAFDLQNNSGAVTYTLTVVNGTGGGAFAAGAFAPVIATAPVGKVFSIWAGDIAHLADATIPSTIATMPAFPITLTALFVDAPPATYTLTVVNGTGSGAFVEGALAPVIAAVPVGKVFSVWAGDTGYLADPTAASTTATMPAFPITVTALFVDAPPSTYTLTVVNGLGSGAYPATTVVLVSAVVPTGSVFDGWSGDTAYLTDPSAAATSATMPAFPITVAARFIVEPPWYPRIPWTPVVGSEWYYLQVWDTVGPELVLETNVKGAEMTPAREYFLAGSDGLLPGTYFWRYCTWDPATDTYSDVWLPSASGQSLSVAYGLPIAPSALGSTPNPGDPGDFVLSFLALNAQGYELEITPDLPLGSPATKISHDFMPGDDWVVPFNRQATYPVTLTGPNTYTWRVRGFNPLGESPWTTGTPIVVNAGTVVPAPGIPEYLTMRPADGWVVTAPSGTAELTFQWEAVPGATGYVIYVSSASGGTVLNYVDVGNVTRVDAINGVRIALPPNTYLWSLIAYSGDDPRTYGGWNHSPRMPLQESPIFFQVVADFKAPTITDAANGVAANTVDITWIGTAPATVDVMLYRTGTVGWATALAQPVTATGATTGTIPLGAHAWGTGPDYLLLTGTTATGAAGPRSRLFVMP